jgi:hypothetical protein
MKREYKYMISNRSLKTKLDVNHYYRVEVSSLSGLDTKYRVVATKSFNKNNPNALTDACDWLKEMTETYC